MNIKLAKDDKIKIQNSEDVFKVMHKVFMRHSKRSRMKEYFWVLGLNSANDIMYVELICVGVLNQVCIDPVEVFCFAIRMKCKKIIVVHNHPSGTLEASRSDIEITRRLIKGGKYLGIEILDHIIITEEFYLSLKDLKVFS